MSGSTGYHAGLAAEDLVRRAYEDQSHLFAATRWRGKGGEIDLIMRNGAEVIFVEVKKSASFARAATRLGRKQMDRLVAAASEFLEGEPKGQLTEVRFDLAVVNGAGEVHIMENAFGEA